MSSQHDTSLSTEAT